MKIWKSHEHMGMEIARAPIVVDGDEQIVVLLQTGAHSYCRAWALLSSLRPATTEDIRGHIEMVTEWPMQLLKEMTDA